ncbi:uncharacterized protein MYCFIDRAFT_179316 [Pseudocercospora fijiensis CIRAD86]|uniref:Uncharacterized protein n=1 Tax=Pseudocercospora fijiensis (strain CIRAD86) TaxID=383855 RepID=M2YJD0_PSEFD|nr:uncharacterized protein MYCFIDRAFT_179316 [Pseudocercospora fijiensis CIRAD86]EME77835.1 hypothetical protein MYCFIDRAFT_179316 [Pseudocercospora fijiensis CIRAD86]
MISSPPSSLHPTILDHPSKTFDESQPKQDLVASLLGMEFSWSRLPSPRSKEKKLCRTCTSSRLKFEDHGLGLEDLSLTRRIFVGISGGGVRGLVVAWSVVDAHLLSGQRSSNWKNVRLEGDD